MNNNPNEPARPCIGRDSAIQNMGGMTWLYEKHLSKFKRDYAKSVSELQILISTNRFEEARILAHSIKGLSGTLGLYNLHLAAGALEKAIIECSPQSEDRLAEFAFHLHCALTESR